MNHENIDIFKTLHVLPLFLGMSNDELENIMTKTKLLFKKVEAEHTIVRAGDNSGKLWILTSGDISVTTSSDDYGYTMTEFLHGPLILQPECAFGVGQRFTRTYKAQTACSLIIIQKEEVMRLADFSLIFRINLVNLISTALQKSSGKYWRRAPQSLQERITRFLTDRMTYPAGNKQVKIKMTRLASELNDTRLNISIVLHRMQDDGLVRLGRGRIDIPMAEKLFCDASSR